MAQEPQPPDPDRLDLAILKLNSLEREVLFLSAREGMPISEIAMRLGLPSETVERHLADALVNLDRLLEKRRARWRFW